MLVQIDGDTYIVKWKHIVPIEGWLRGRTDCEIKKVDSPEIRMASAKCSCKDQYNKNIGRKLSLKRAIYHFELKEDRRKFWEAYKDMRGGKF